MISLGSPRLGLLLAGVSLVALGCKGEAPAKSDANEGPPPARVQVAEVRGGSIQAEWSFLGDVRALKRAKLAAGAGGEVREVRVRVGDHVKKGDLLVDIDPSLATARVRAAQASKQAGAADLERAQRDAERLTVAGPDIAARAEIEQATSERKRAVAERGRLKAAEAEARAQLGRHRVRAPFDGVVANRAVDPGDWVEPGVEVIELVDDAGVEVLVSTPPDVALYLEADDKALLRYKGAAVPATIVGVVRALDDESRTVKVRLVPDENAVWLLPGAAIDVVLTIERSEPGAVVIPRDALVYGIADLQVIKVADGHAEPVPIEIIARGRDEILIKADGLAAGDAVVTRGNERVFPGQPLTIVPED
ncbi:MAG: efflux RND transporter periplasmic adaptor subunit [Myxococcales bacterium]|nr:efflux RND transporter periplasmic adaptor subunit [Myxococcales bacterium]MDH3486380.1 efflux RND transporter periplasmic adaptor subunit [Myxococcales bacterium]